MVVPHTPRIIHEETAPAFLDPLTGAMHHAREWLDRMNGSGLVIISCHWVSSFNHYLDATPVHEGRLTAQECPDLIRDVTYHFPGHPEVAQQIADRAASAGMPMYAIDDPAYVWDYGSVVPLRYLTPTWRWLWLISRFV
ncbi:Extradiol ring-cleavage dioxygenase class III protein subunit B [Sulfobacillus acidophilus TPY]|nr:Extradiol ring-cleavage dioxygenase class III protein subunit B [Sulfobacillus acidophilus TPY]